MTRSPIIHHADFQKTSKDDTKEINQRETKKKRLSMKHGRKCEIMKAIGGSDSEVTVGAGARR